MAEEQRESTEHSTLGCGDRGVFWKQQGGGKESSEKSTLENVKLMDLNASSLEEDTAETFKRLNNSVLGLPSTLSVPSWLVVPGSVRKTHLCHLASKWI